MGAKMRDFVISVATRFAECGVWVTDRVMIVRLFHDGFTQRLHSCMG
jgi:hypothetical protein